MDIGTNRNTRKFVGIRDMILRLPKIDNSLPYKTFYRGYTAFFLTTATYLNVLNIFNIRVGGKL